MTETRKSLTDLYCEGQGKRFKNRRCGFFISSEKLCRLLKNRQTKEFWDKCGYPNFEFLHKYIDKYMARFAKRLGKQYVDDKADIEYKEIIEKLQNSGRNFVESRRKEEKSWGVMNLPAWNKYIDKTAYWEVRKIYSEIYQIGLKKKCGTCRHLSLKSVNRSFFCLKKGEERKKGSNFCEEYAALSPFIESGPEGFNPPDERGNETDSTEKEKTTFFALFLKQLDERAKKEKPGSARRKKFTRQYLIVINLLNAFREGSETKEAIEILTNETGIKKKMRNRDIEEVRTFLEEKCPELAELFSFKVNKTGNTNNE